MKRILAVITVLAALLSLPTYAISFNRDQVNKEAPTNLSKTLSAASAAELTTDTLLYSKNENTVVPSHGGITRLMAAVTIEVQSKNNSIIKSGFTEEVYEGYLAALLINNSKAAARALAIEACGGEKEFVDLMNTTAKQLGMVSSHFTSVDGEEHREAVTTIGDLMILAYEAYELSHIKSILSSNIYYSIDGESSYSRDYSVINPVHRMYIKEVNFYFAGDFGDTGYVSLVGAMSQNGREMLVVSYESGSYVSDYKNNYALDIKYILNTCFGKYYLAELTNVAKAVVHDMDGFLLADGTKVYASVEIPEGEPERVTLPMSYGEIILDNYTSCSVALAPLPASGELDKILTTGVLKYKNDELMRISLRVYRIVLENGQEYRSDYSLYSEEDGAQRAALQYKRNDWIFVSGLVCGCAIIAVFAAEFLKRRLM